MTIEPARYDDEVEKMASHLCDDAECHADAADDPEHPEHHLLDAVVDTLDGHPWFSGGLGPAYHGAIIEHGTDFTPYRDVSTLTDSDDPDEIVKRLAHAAFEADVIDAAHTRLTDE